MKYPNGEKESTFQTALLGTLAVSVALIVFPSATSAQTRHVDPVRDLDQFSDAVTSIDGDVFSSSMEVPEDDPVIGPNQSKSMHRAREAYEKGFDLVKSKSDYANALTHFSSALCRARLPKILFAIAQCEKTLGRDIEAIFFFAESLNLNYLMELQYNLDRDRFETAKDNIELLTKRLLDVFVVAPEGDPVIAATHDGLLWLETDLFGYWKEKKQIAGISPELISVLHRHRHHLRGGDECSTGVLSEQKEVDEMLTDLNLLPKTTEKKPFVFLIKPGVYSFEFILKSGRKIYIEDKSIYADLTIDLTSEEWPAELIIDNPQEETAIVLMERRLAQDDRSHTRVVYTNAEERARGQFERDGESDVENKLGDTIEIKGLRTGRYDLTAKRDGYVDFHQTYVLEVGQKKNVTLDMRSKPVYKNWKFWLGMGLTAAAISVGVSVPLAIRMDGS
jgi:hypothetical protein